MSAADLETFRAWVEGGTPQGDTTEDAPYQAPKSEFAPTKSAQVPGYVPNTTEADDWRCFVLPELSAPETQYLHGTQVVPSTSLVHHVLVYALPGSQLASLQAADEADDGAGYTCFGSPTPGTSEAGSGSLSTFANGFPNQIAGWVPGAVPAMFPEDTSIQVESNAVVVMQVHYNTLAYAAEADTTELQLQIDTVATPYLSITRPVAIPTIEIPAGESDVSFTQAYPNYGDPITMRTIMAHMHMLGTQESLRVKHENGDETCVLDIPDWDFNWQQTYSFLPDEPVTVGTGDALELSCSYDNSAENQPIVDGQQQAPRDVSWGESSLDEMCLAYFSKIEPWSEPAPEGDTACAGTEACLAACGENPSLDCLLSCPESDVGCFTCALSGLSACGGTACATEVTAARDCLVTCAGASVMLDGNLGTCLNEQCPEQYAAVQSCLDPILSSEECAESLAACGIE